LFAKYKKEQLVLDIMEGKFWKGQTEEQLQDSLGKPDVVDTVVLKTKRKEVWKYQEIQRGQFSLRVTLENGKVIGWDQKS
jgi:hypothetical protein